jgi:hypothetical protein
MHTKVIIDDNGKSDVTVSLMKCAEWAQFWRVMGERVSLFKRYARAFVIAGINRLRRFLSRKIMRFHCNLPAEFEGEVVVIAKAPGTGMFHGNIVMAVTCTGDQ